MSEYTFHIHAAIQEADNEAQALIDKANEWLAKANALRSLLANPPQPQATVIEPEAPGQSSATPAALAPVIPETWFRIHDNHSGGGNTCGYDDIYVQAADVDGAIARFEEMLDVTYHQTNCDCCGPNYSYPCEIDSEDVPTRPGKGYTIIPAFGSRY